MTQKLIIKQPRMVTMGGVARVTCEVVEASEEGGVIKKNVTFDVDRRYRKYIVTENANAYLVGLLPYAMRNDMDIEIESSVSSDLLHNIEMLLIPHLVKYDKRLYLTKISTKKAETKPLKSLGAVGTGMSMGVDSFFTVDQYISSKYKDFKLTHLFVEQVGDLTKGVSVKKYKRNVNKDTVSEVAQALGLPVVYAYSNFRQLFRMNHYHTHTFSAMFYVHMLAKLFKVYLYSSTEDFSHFRLNNNSTHDAALYELLSLQALSSGSLRLISGGASSSRLEKTRQLADSKVARRFLRVCLKGELNCGVCMKCRRTLLTLDMQETLDMFSNVFDIPSYRKNKPDYLRWLIRAYHKNNNGISIKELYGYFCRTEKIIMNKLIDQHIKSYEPMESPRRFLVVDNVQAVNPSTGEKYESEYKKGDVILFVDKIYMNGVCYLRSEEDSIHARSCAVPIGHLTEAK